MTETAYCGIELLPPLKHPRQLFVLLHGAGATASDLLPLAQQLRAVYPDAGYLIPQGSFALANGEGGDWFPTRDLTEENRPGRIAEAMPTFHALVRQAQDRLNVLPSDTALVGFSQGGMMALEFSAAHDGGAGRVLAFSARYAVLPERAPELTTLHLLHGEQDKVIPVEHAHAAYATLTALQGDVTLDLALSVGHEVASVLIERAIYRLQTCVPLRSWKRALDGA